MGFLLNLKLRFPVMLLHHFNKNHCVPKYAINKQRINSFKLTQKIENYFLHQESCIMFKINCLY